MLFNILNAMAAPETAFALKTDKKTIQLVAYHIKRQLSKTHYTLLSPKLLSLWQANHLIENPKAQTDRYFGTTQQMTIDQFTVA